MSTAIACIQLTVTVIVCLSVANLKFTKKFHRAKPKPKPTVDVTNTKDEQCVEKFQNLLSRQFCQTHEQCTIDVATERFHSTVTKCAMSAFGCRKCKQPDRFKDSPDVLLWEIEVKCDARNKVHTRETRSSKALLKAVKHNCRHLTHVAKHCYWSRLSDCIQSCADKADKGLASGIREAIGPIPEKSASLLSEDGVIITDPNKQLERWMEHCWFIIFSWHSGIIRGAFVTTLLWDLVWLR